MSTAFSYGTITDEDVKKTKAFVENCTKKLQEMTTDKEKRQYLERLFRNEVNPTKSSYSAQSTKKETKSN